MIFALVLIFSAEGEFAAHAERVVATREECRQYIQAMVAASDMKKFSGFCIDMSIAKEKPLPKGSTEL